MFPGTSSSSSWWPSLFGGADDDDEEDEEALDVAEAEEELIMVLSLIVFGTIVAIGLTYIAMLTYRNYYYPPLPPKSLEPQVVEFELVEKGEEVKETDDPF